MNHGKKFLKIVSSFCAASMMTAFLCATQVSAATAVRKAGDVDGNGTVTSADATLLQRYLNKSVTLDSTSLTAADVNFDGSVNIRDVTTIQLYLAKKDTITPLKDTKWTSLSAKSSKVIRFKSALKTSRVSIGKVPGWISTSMNISGNSFTGITLFTSANTTALAKSATVTIKVDGNAYTVTVKQMPKVTTPGWAMCYHYAMQWDNDPRANDIKPFDYDNKTGDHADPGFISGKAAYKSFSTLHFNFLEDSNFYNNFKTDYMNRIKADLETLGWGIKEKSGPDDTVNGSDWLVCATFNPREGFNVGFGDPKMVTINKIDANTSDYHWYRRTGSAGNYRWSHKPGKQAVRTLAAGKTPVDYDATNNKYTYITLSDYNKALANYMQGYAAFNAEHPNDHYTYKATSQELPAMRNAVNSYFILGYYEVGPNAF